MKTAIAHRNATTKNRFVYIVTNTVRGEPKGVTIGPLLGAFSAERGALDHFGVVVEDRERLRGYKKVFVHDYIPLSPYTKENDPLPTIARAQFERPDGATETITVVRARLVKGKRR